MPGVKTNEREGTRAVLRHSRMSAYKARQVLDLIRGKDVELAADILANGDREAAAVIGKVLASAVANAVHNDGLDAEDLFISACYADEGSTLKRWRPRARGRATRIRKRTCHVTIIVSRMPDERIARRRAKASTAAGQRSRRVASSRRTSETDVVTDPEVTTLSTDEAASTDVATDETTAETTADDTTTEMTTDEETTDEETTVSDEMTTDEETTVSDEAEPETTADEATTTDEADTAEEKG